MAALDMVFNGDALLVSDPSNAYDWKEFDPSKTVEAEGGGVGGIRPNRIHDGDVDDVVDDGAKNDTDDDDDDVEDDDMDVEDDEESRSKYVHHHTLLLNYYLHYMHLVSMDSRCGCFYLFSPCFQKLYLSMQTSYY